MSDESELRKRVEKLIGPQPVHVIRNGRVIHKTTELPELDGNTAFALKEKVLATKAMTASVSCDKTHIMNAGPVYRSDIYIGWKHWSAKSEESPLMAEIVACVKALEAVSDD